MQLLDPNIPLTALCVLQREQLFPPQPASLDADMQQLHLQTQPMQNGQDQQPLLMVRHLQEHLFLTYQTQLKL